jgi:N-acetylglucosaminyldiphosphoundecaprenol N-acetyl-beta-D-mannosaminyltransferase
MAGVPERVDVIGSWITACDASAALDLLENRIEQGEGGYVCFTNVHAAVMGRRDERFRRITNTSYLSLADGTPVFWVGRIKGHRYMGHVPGPDFFLRTFKRFPLRRHFLYGSTPQVLKRLEDNLRRALPEVNVCGAISPAFGPLSEDDRRRHYAAIRESGAEFVWVGLGAPKQEQWMAEAWQHLKPSVLLGVGAAFDFHAGTLRRAPLSLRRLGLEWLHRFSQEPRRLWRRYLVANTLFLAYLVKDLFRRKSDAIDNS